MNAAHAALPGTELSTVRSLPSLYKYASVYIAHKLTNSFSDLFGCLPLP